jgi:hypothetical protein
VLRRTIKPKRYEFTGDRRKLHNAEFQNFYSAPTILRMIEEHKMGRAWDR